MSNFRVELLAELFPPLLQHVLGVHLDAGKIDFRQLALGRLPGIANDLVSKSCSSITSDQDRSMALEPILCGLGSIIRSCRLLNSAKSETAVLAEIKNSLPPAIGEQLERVVSPTLRQLSGPQLKVHRKFVALFMGNYFKIVLECDSWESDIRWLSGDAEVQANFHWREWQETQFREALTSLKSFAPAAELESMERSCIDAAVKLRAVCRYLVGITGN